MTNKSQARSAISDQRSAISDQRSAISDQRSAISDQRSAISDQRSAIILGAVSRCVIIGLGVLLLLAAALKLHGAAFDPVRPTGILAHPALQFAIILIEIALAFWFISGIQRALAWAAAFGTFSLFAVVSFRQGWIGEASCGCFGNVAVNPWLVFSIDVAVLAVRFFVRPDRGDLSASLPSLTRFAPALGIFAVIFAAFAGVAVWRHGSFDAALAHLRGEIIGVTPQIVDLGQAECRSAQSANVSIANYSSDELLIYGGTADCQCTVVGNLPVRIAAGETRSILVRVRMPRQPGQFTRWAKLMTDADGARTLSFRITGRGIEAPRVADNR